MSAPMNPAAFMAAQQQQQQQFQPPFTPAGGPQSQMELAAMQQFINSQQAQINAMAGGGSVGGVGGPGAAAFFNGPQFGFPPQWR
jgi:hypothetical protein